MAGSGCESCSRDCPDVSRHGVLGRIYRLELVLRLASCRQRTERWTTIGRDEIGIGHPQVTAIHAVVICTWSGRAVIGQDSA
jgi:hypothetical protein